MLLGKWINHFSRVSEVQYKQHKYNRPLFFTSLLCKRACLNKLILLVFGRCSWISILGLSPLTPCKRSNLKKPLGALGFLLA